MTWLDLYRTLAHGLGLIPYAGLVDIVSMTNSSSGHRYFNPKRQGYPFRPTVARSPGCDMSHETSPWTTG